MILACQNINKSFGEHTILKDASFHIEEREKAALIGSNGAGKTTLLRIIIHELPRTPVRSSWPGTKPSAISPSTRTFPPTRTIYEELLSTKQHILDLESRIRSLEEQISQASPRIWNL